MVDGHGVDFTAVLGLRALLLADTYPPYLPHPPPQLQHHPRQFHPSTLWALDTFKLSVAMSELLNYILENEEAFKRYAPTSE
jgi:hypothetical protein